jgi:hypothetical protein
VSPPGTARRLRLVRPAGQAIDGLLAALDQWAAAGPDRSEPVAYLEAGDGELYGDFPLTAAKVTELAALLRATAGPEDGR